MFFLMLLLYHLNADCKIKSKRRVNLELVRLDVEKIYFTFFSHLFHPIAIQ